ncbi:CU044_2847 family protein [Kitasatospora sp. cg17-2]
MYKEIVDEKGEAAFLVELHPLPAQSLDQTSLLRGARTRQQQALQELNAAGVAVAEACRQVIGEVRDRLSEAAPDELEITFGVSLAGEGGIPLIGKVSADSTFEVRALWKKAGSAGEQGL